MSGIALNLPWDSQPQEAVGPSTLFNRGSSLWNLNAINTRDLVTGVATTAQGSTHKLEPSRDGLGVYCTSQSTSNYFDTNLASVSGNEPRSLIVVFQHGESSGYVTLIQTGVQGTEDFSIYGQHIGIPVDLRFGVWGLTSIDVAINTFPVGSTLCAIFTHDGATRKAYVNGRSFGSESSVLNTTAGNVRLAGGNVLNGPLAPVIAAAQLPYCLSDAQANQVSADPWQLFAPRQIWIPASGSISPVPTLSLPTAINITASSLQPRVSYAF